MPLFEIMLFIVKTLKMGFSKTGWRNFFLFLDLRPTLTNAKKGAKQFPMDIFCFQAKIKNRCEGKLTKTPGFLQGTVNDTSLEILIIALLESQIKLGVASTGNCHAHQN